MAGMDNNNNVSGDMADCPNGNAGDGGPLANVLREHLEEHYNLRLRREIRNRWLYGDDQDTRGMEEKESG
jgi:hypothetical protein